MTSTGRGTTDLLGGRSPATRSTLIRAPNGSRERRHCPACCLHGSLPLLRLPKPGDQDGGRRRGVRAPDDARRRTVRVNRAFSPTSRRHRCTGRRRLRQCLRLCPPWVTVDLRRRKCKLLGVTDVWVGLCFSLDLGAAYMASCGSPVWREARHDLRLR